MRTSNGNFKNAAIFAEIAHIPVPRAPFFFIVGSAADQIIVGSGNEDRPNRQSRTQSLQAFWSAGQRREDSGDIEKIQFF